MFSCLKVAVRPITCVHTYDLTRTHAHQLSSPPNSRTYVSVVCVRACVRACERDLPAAFGPYSLVATTFFTSPCET